MLRISLRQLLVLVATVAVAIVSLCYANAGWEAAVYCLTLVVFFAMVIVAFIDRGSRQTFAIGMAIVMAGYTGVQTYGPKKAFRHFGMPTNSLLIALHQAISEPAHFDARSGARLEGFSPPAGAAPGTAQIPNTYVDYVPLTDHLVPIGHMWFSILFGCFGGLFARWVFLRRVKAVPSGG
jgi:hypothetical protein